MSTRQGRCHPCSVRYVWPNKSRLLVGDVKCPDCGAELQVTSKNYSGVAHHLWVSIHNIACLQPFFKNIELGDVLK